MTALIDNPVQQLGDDEQKMTGRRTAFMFDDLIETLKSLQGMKVSVPAAVQADKDGYIDRQYPATECEFLFKVH